ncbi:OLC1v1033892C1 [Oldenlandia corymbosa var. corymbosa]|uniref:OLC1v1033892C1 n=1 Tax=Oldenlandia corymbosa var. corymbosa TaxID=529605 RepID=A0AAV1CQ24_OLDCO|nr:OLC1v1033892C1 [Oldenlandia corymbosa var. corymbosa]
MEYSLVGSLRKDSFIPSVPGIRGICSTTSSSGAAPVLDCKRWNNTDHKHFPKSIQISRKQQLLMSTTSTTRLVAAISRGSENDEIMVNPAADVHDVYPFEAEEASNTPLTSLLHNLDAFKRFICLHGLVATVG